MHLATYIKGFLLFLILLQSHYALALESISIVTDDANRSNPISSKAINEFQSLMKKACNCDVSINNENAQILIQLPNINLNRSNLPKTNDKAYAVLRYPAHHYKWTSGREGSKLKLVLETPSFQGISFGLYGLLQEQLWFQFYHPKQTYIPKIDNWPLTENFTWEVNPRFEKKGFHLHTMHPIELTEALLDVNFSNGIQEIKIYIDWLARNQQNYFEFNLLESIDRKKWVSYIKEAVDYGKSRGIIMGVDLSLHMTQQKAFMLYRSFPKSFISKKKQIEKNVNYLSEAGFEVYNVEFSTTEFTAGNLKKKRLLQLYLGELLEKKGIKLMGREHVVKKDKMLIGKKQKDLNLSPEQQITDSKRGLLVHTVMFYNIFEENAPVYRNKNLQHMLEIFKSEVKKRETWYYPESAYWITFDNAVPMTLLPYLKARLDDIRLMDSLGAEGHITFSSGWEWGYWLTDWSIARWSWNQKFNGEKLSNDYLEYAAVLSQDAAWTETMNKMLDLQQTFIKEKELIRYMAPLSFSDELPDFLNLEFQPKPIYTNKFLLNKAMPYQLDTLKKNAVEPLIAFTDSCATLIAELGIITELLPNGDAINLGREFVNGLRITGLRAKHRAYILSYLIEKREAGIKKLEFSDPKQHLASAAKLREEALKIVKLQEANYRYPEKWLSEIFKSKTAYDFGYLYTVADLHYWKREEEQCREKKYGPFFMNIMNVWRILGIVN